MEFDRSSEPEPLQFSDLPVDAVGLIVDKLKVVDKLRLRRVSKSLQEFIEKQVFNSTDISVSFEADCIIFSWSITGHILYAKHDKAVKFCEKGVDHAKLLFVYGDESEVCDDLACFLKNPKLRLVEFNFSNVLSCVEVGVFSTFLAKLENALKSLEHQISVKKFSLRAEHPDNVLAILPYLKPGYLETIQIDHVIEISDWKSDENSRKVEQIMQLDQWKQAKELVLMNSFHLFPEELFAQFKKYRIRTLTLDQSQLTRIGMMFATSPVFEHCFFCIHHPSYDYNFMDSISIPRPLEERCSVRHYMIPDTDKLLVFKEFTFGFFRGSVEIEKKAREA